MNKRNVLFSIHANTFCLHVYVMPLAIRDVKIQDSSTFELIQSDSARLLNLYSVDHTFNRGETQSYHTKKKNQSHSKW